MVLQKRASIPALDGLRAVAAFVVLLSHFSNATGFLDYSVGKGAGQVGVILFFALSGFLMCYVTDAVEPNPANILEFWRRRVARVLPLYVFIVLAAYLLAKQTFAGESLKVYDVNDANLLQHLLLLRGVNVLWTIPIEICFYVLFPLIWYLRHRLKSDAALSVILLAVFMVWDSSREFLWTRMDTEIRFLEVVLRGHFFLLGILAYLAFRRMPPLKPNGLWLVLMLLLPLNYRNIIGLFVEGAYQPWAEPGTFIWVTLVLFATARSSWAEWALGNPVLRYLGRISYSIYLTHMFVLQYMRRFYTLDKSPVSLLILVGLVIGLSSLTYFLVEKPCRAVLNRIGRRPVPAAV